jgi:hypothetical protein
MDTRRRLASVTLMVAGSLLLSASSVLAACHPVPFKASLSGTATLTSPTSGELVGAGSASHMGSITNAGHVQAYPDQPSSSCPNGFVSVNTETLTAANGDRLTLTSQDVACPQGPGQFQGSGDWTVTGGTGRFKGASGRGSLQGVVDFSAGTFSISFDGSIQY